MVWPAPFLQIAKQDNGFPLTARAPQTVHAAAALAGNIRQPVMHSPAPILQIAKQENGFPPTVRAP